MTYRVINWATGHTGRMVVRATAERPDYEIVGAFVYSAEKSGRDLGEIAGIGPLGVLATSDRRQILDLPADCVLFLGGAEQDVPGAVRDICALLASGKNVITTAANFIYPKSLGADVERQIAAACEQGRATFHGLGIMPGFLAESVPLMLARLSRRIDRIVASEVLSYDKYPSHFQMFNLMGFGHAPDDPTPAFANLGNVGETWRHSGMLMADTLGLPIDRIENFRNVRLADRDIQVAAGLIKAGTVGAMNFGVRVISEGRERVVLQHFTRMAPHLAPEWPDGHGWLIDLEGEPTIHTRIEIGSESILPTDDACMATGMHAVHAVPYVVAAPPGILLLTQAPPAIGLDGIRQAKHADNATGPV